jgi:hypothetical protein
VKMAAAATLIDAILESDRKAPRKRRHMARRIFDRIRAEVRHPRGCRANGRVSGIQDKRETGMLTSRAVGLCHHENHQNISGYA